MAFAGGHQARPVARHSRSDGGVTPGTACLQRLATALSAYSDIDVRVRTDGPAPYLAARNIDSRLSETVTVKRLDDGLAFLWSWGERIGDASDPDRVARSVAYVLAAASAQLTGHKEDEQP